jgi:hypothetical protein
MRTTVLCSLGSFCFILCAMYMSQDRNPLPLVCVLLWKAMYSMACDADGFKYQLSVVMT